MAEDDDAADRQSRAERYRRQLIKALEECRTDFPAWRKIDPSYLVNLLFSYLDYSFDLATARHLFMQQGRPKEPREMTDIRNSLLLDSYDMVKAATEKSGGKFVEADFLRACAKANEDLQAEDRRGAGGTDVVNLRQHLRMLRKG